MPNNQFNKGKLFNFPTVKANTIVLEEKNKISIQISKFPSGLNFKP